MDEIDAAVSAGMRDGWVKPPIGKTYTLDQAPAAHNDVINNQGTLGRLIIKVCWYRDVWLFLKSNKDVLLKKMYTYDDVISIARLIRIKLLCIK